MARAFDLQEPIGRDQELAETDGLLLDVAGSADSPNRHARALLLGGDAGIGKTTLVHAVGSRASAVGLGFGVGHCLDLATGPPFGPVLEALRALVRSGDAGRSDKPASAAWLADADPGAARSLEELLAATESLAEAAPFVLVLEDVHWADTSVRSWAIALVRTCRAPLLLGLTFRSEELGRDHPLRPVLVDLARTPGTLRLELHGLGAGPVTELARRRTGRYLERGVIESLLTRTDGNPLFVEELLEAEGSIPVLLHDLLVRHVDRLPIVPRRLAHLASAGGTVVDVDLLQDASELSPDVYTAALQALLDANVLVRRGDVFSFRHALLREAVDADLLPSQRAQLHAAYARALRPRVEAGDSAQRLQYGAGLALHAYAAHDLTLAFDASVWAGLAGKQYGAAAAADHFERALELWDRVPDPGGRSGLARTDLPTLAARVLYDDDPDRVHALLRQAVTLLRPGSDPLAACRVYTAIVSEYSQVSGVLSQDEALDKALNLAGNTPSRELAEALVAGCFHQAHKNVGPELGLAQRCLEVALSVGAGDVVPDARWAVFNALWRLGRCEEGLEVYRLALRDAEQADQTGAALNIAAEIAFYLLLLGRIDEGLALARRTRASAEQAGLPRFVAFAAEQEAEWLIRDGQLAAAEKLFKEACLPGGSAFRQDWLRAWLMLAHGEGAAALALEREAAAAHLEDRLTLDHTPRLIEACEQVGDLVGMLSTTTKMVLELAVNDSPLVQAQLASYGLRALILAGGARLPASAELVQASHAALASARAQESSQWEASWYGMHLSFAVAHNATLDERPAVEEWRRASDLALRHGRYTALRPRLELARALLDHGPRAEGKELLIATWHDARTIGAGWIERQAALVARRLRVALPLHSGGPGPLNRLTPREREVLELVATGATDRAIAAALFISEKTASAHVGRVLTKLGVANRGQAAAVARSANQPST